MLSGILHCSARISVLHCSAHQPAHQCRNAAHNEDEEEEGLRPSPLFRWRVQPPPTVALLPDSTILLHIVVFMLCHTVDFHGVVLLARHHNMQASSIPVSCMPARFPSSLEQCSMSTSAYQTLHVLAACYSHRCQLVARFSSSFGRTTLRDARLHNMTP